MLDRFAPECWRIHHRKWTIMVMITVTIMVMITVTIMHLACLVR